KHTRIEPTTAPGPKRLPPQALKREFSSSCTSCPESPIFSLFPRPTCVAAEPRLIRCTPLAEVESTQDGYVLDSRGLASMCQVTKGARGWSWHKTCNPNDLHFAMTLANQVQGVT